MAGRVFVAALFLALTVPRMTQPGMFADGVVYASIARNLAEGNGKFWAPAYTTTVYPTFFEQPPLGIALESLAFRLFGDSLAVERLYSIACAALTAVLIATIWRRSAGDTRIDWLPVLFWLLPSAVTWSIVNNMLETSQAVFTTAATLLAILAMSGRHTLLAAATCGVAIGGAVLVKGPIGFFPLMVPAIYAAVHDRRTWRRAAVVTAIVVAVLAVTAMVLAANTPSREALEAYARAHVRRLSTQGGLSPLRSVVAIGSDVLLRMGALLALVWALTGRRLSQGENSWSAFFLAVAVGASLAVTVTAGDTTSLVPTVPLFALAVAVPAARCIAGTGEAPGGRASRRAAPVAAGIAAALLISATVGIPLARGAVEVRDEDLIGAIRTVAPALPHGGVVGTCRDLATDWALHAYLQRFYRVSLDAGARHSAYVRLTTASCPPADGCLLVRFARGMEVYSCDVGR